MSLDTGSKVSYIGLSMMSILVGSWDDDVGKSMTISEVFHIMAIESWCFWYQYQHHQGMRKIQVWLFDPQQEVVEDTKLGL